MNFITIAIPLFNPKKMPSLKQIISGVTEILSDLTRSHDNDDDFERKRMLPSLGVVPLCMIGRKYSFNMELKKEHGKKKRKTKQKKPNKAGEYFIMRLDGKLIGQGEDNIRI